MSMWKDDSDSEEEYNEEFNIPPNDIDSDFVNDLLNIKHELYEEIVLTPKLGTSDAQNNNLLNIYLERIRAFYLLSKDAQNGLNSQNNAKNIHNALVYFSEESQQRIKKILDWIADYFTKNSVSDTIPYKSYLENHLYVYPFIQTAEIFY